MKLIKFCFLVVLVFLTNSSYAQFFCPNGVRTIVNELDFEINIETNEIIFDLTCDPCSYADGGSSCECHDDCREDQKSDYYDCIDECERFNSPPQIDDCIRKCNSKFDKECVSKCGNLEVAQRSVDRFAYAFNFWWTHGLTESQQGPPDESFVSNVMDGFTSKLIHSSTEDFENKSISYCYQYEVFVEYDDGTCCRYVGAACFQKG